MASAAPQGYTGQLSVGDSVFTLAIDDAPFNEKLTRAESNARNTSKNIGQAFGKGGNASMGLLYLGQAVDDMQYGFRAIVNNIPQVTMALGGTAGIAGAVGIIAVAINQVVSHWDELKATISQSEPITTALGNIKDKVDELAQSLTGLSAHRLFGNLEETLFPQLNVFEPILKKLGLGKEARAVGKEQAREKALGEKAIEDVSGVRDKAAEERAKMFREATREYGGGEKLLREYTQRLINRFPEIDPKEAERMAARAIESGLRGERMAPGQFGLGFEKEYSRQMEKNMAERRKKAEAQLDKRTHEDIENERSLFEEDKREKMQKLQDRQRGLSEAQQAIQKTIHDRPRHEIFSSTQEMVRSMQTGVLNQVPKAQLKKLEQIHNEMRRLNEQMRNVQRTRFE